MNESVKVTAPTSAQDATRAAILGNLGEEGEPFRVAHVRVHLYDGNQELDRIAKRLLGTIIPRDVQFVVVGVKANDGSLVTMSACTEANISHPLLFLALAELHELLHTMGVLGGDLCA